jgi:hypothetical protein
LKIIDIVFIETDEQELFEKILCNEQASERLSRLLGDMPPSQSAA